MGFKIGVFFILLGITLLQMSFCQAAKLGSNSQQLKSDFNFQLADGEGPEIEIAEFSGRYRRSIANANNDSQPSPESSTSKVATKPLQFPSRNCNMFARNSCICRFQFKPLCGSDGITYANNCQFECARRCNPGLTFRRCGACWQRGNPSSRSCLT